MCTAGITIEGLIFSRAAGAIRIDDLPFHPEQRNSGWYFDLVRQKKPYFAGPWLAGLAPLEGRVFNNGTGLVKQWVSPTDHTLIDVPKGGGKVQLFLAPQGSAYTPWVSSVTPAAWYAWNTGWKLEDPIGFTTPTPGKFNGGVLTLLPLQPGAFIDYVIIGWTGNAQSFDEAVAANSLYNVSSKFGTATGTRLPFLPAARRHLRRLVARPLTPEPSSFALAALGAATLLALHRRK